MRILHTSDWHVGKTIRGQSRLDEHRAVLAEVVDVVRTEAVDVALVVGDLFESAAPVPEAQALVWDTLLALRATGAKVVVVGGNHDNPLALDALRPVMAALGIVLLGRAAAPADGGVVEVRVDSGERARIALLPFVSQRYAVRGAQLMDQDAAANAGDYAERVGMMIRALTSSFSPDTVNIVAAHCMAVGGRLGGGERDAQTIFEYALSPAVFPPAAHYVALGHLHRTQPLAGACPIWYSGSPLQLDFGEQDDDKHVLVVEATPTTPATVRPVQLHAGRRLRTVRGTLDEVLALAGTTGDDFLRVVVQGPARVGLAEDVRTALPEAVEVRTERGDGDSGGDGGRASGAEGRAGRSPHELFGAFLHERGVEDGHLLALFGRLLDDETAGAHR